MGTIRSEEQWMELIKEYTVSGLNITDWCSKKKLNKSSFYRHLKKVQAPAAEPLEQKWVSITLPKRVEAPSISLTVGTFTLDIKNGFDKETLMDILGVVMKL